MSDNVFIFGAGVSFDAGIPLMGNFMDVMWKMAQTGKHRDKTLDDNEKKILSEALTVREELDSYHGRVAVDVWNIEDLLSILSMNALAGGKKEKNRLSWMIKAIALVIEATGQSAHSGKLNTIETESGPAIYQNFWHTLINWCRENEKTPPCIITFNYDLILERALLQAIVGTNHTTKSFPWGRIDLSYGSSSLGALHFNAKHSNWENYTNDQFVTHQGISLENADFSPSDEISSFPVQLFKLHGSLNFPQGIKNSIAGENQNTNLVTALENPAIVPPVFNKATNPKSTEIWKNALAALRNCKNVIICGYSLPASDVYMQYFFKSALGPNQNLSNIYVFDPVLFEPDKKDDAEALRQRYASNFSPALRNRISFDPPYDKKRDSDKKGTFMHMIYLLNKYPDSILFS